MNRVLVIHSVHREHGRASVSALASILEQVRPDVIFLELSAAGLARCLEGGPAPLEVTAALRYRDRHAVALVPVDTLSPSLEFAQRVGYMFDRVEHANPEYGRLHDLQLQYVRAAGFAYLNSEDGSVLSAAIDETLRSTVEELRDDRLSAIYTSWTEAHEMREMGMIRGIEDYAKVSPFETGVFPVGLAHRRSLVGKTSDERPAPCVDWDFSGPF